jgi:hypothetical protein
VIGLRIHRRELHRRLADHFDPTEALVFLVFSVLLADAAHQPVAGPVEQGGGGAVLGGDRLRVERVPQFGGAVVEGEGVVHGRFGSGFGRVDEQHLAVALPEDVAAHRDIVGHARQGIPVVVASVRVRGKLGPW